MGTHDIRPLSHFSISLAAKDIAASRGFYEKLAFAVIGGEREQNWLIPQIEYQGNLILFDQHV